MNRMTKGKGLFGSVTLDGGATLKGNAKGNIDLTGYSKTAAGSNGWYYQVEQIDGTALTGTLRAGYFVATNGTTAATGTIRGLEAKARAADSSNVGANVAYLEALSLSADAKTKNVTRMYGIEVMLDGAAGGTTTLAVGLQISNNASNTQTNSYAIRINQTGGGHKAFTKDIILQNGETIDNATDGTIAFTAGVLKLAYDAAAYMTITQADGAGVTFDSVSDGTAGFAFSDAVAVTGVVTIKYDAAAYMTITQADAGGVTFASVSDGTPLFTFSQAVALSGTLTMSDAVQAAANAHLKLNTQTDTYTVRINSRDYAATSGDIIGFQSKPAANADGTATVYGGQISPRFNDGIGGAALVGLQIEPILKGATAKAITGDVRALDLRLSDDGNAGHTVGGVATCIKMYNLMKSSTFTGGVIPIVVTAAGDTQAWTALMEIPEALSGGADGGGAAVYIPITINGVAARITAKYVS